MNFQHFTNVIQNQPVKTESIAQSFQSKELDNCVDDEIKLPKTLEFLQVDDDLQVQLQYNGMPLPQWSVQGHNVTPKKVTYLENFPAYIRNTATDNYNELLNELNQRNFYKPQGRPPYASVVRYALHLRYTLLQAYRLFFERFPIPYLSLLNKIQQGGVDMLNVLKHFMKKAPFLVTVF